MSERNVPPDCMDMKINDGTTVVVILVWSGSRTKMSIIVVTNQD